MATGNTTSLTDAELEHLAFESDNWFIIEAVNDLNAAINTIVNIRIPGNSTHVENLPLMRARRACHEKINDTIRIFVNELETRKAAHDLFN